MAKFFQIGHTAYDLSKATVILCHKNQIEMVFEGVGTVIRVMNSEEEAQAQYQAMLLLLDATHAVVSKEKPQIEQ